TAVLPSAKTLAVPAARPMGVPKFGARPRNQCSAPLQRALAEKVIETATRSRRQRTARRSLAEEIQPGGGGTNGVFWNLVCGVPRNALVCGTANERARARTGDARIRGGRDDPSQGRVRAA